MSTALVWFRQDLRCTDNPALALACAEHQQVIPLYIKELKPRIALGGAQQWWLYHSLTALQKELQKGSLDLYFRQAEPLPLLQELIATHSIDVIYWNRCYEPAHTARDKHIKTALKKLGVKVITCNSALLHEPWDIVNKAGSHFKVFTPYWRHCLRHMQLRPLYTIEHWPEKHAIASDCLDDWDLLPSKPNWAKSFHEYWQPGEQGAIRQLDSFLSNSLNQYKLARDKPSQLGTSCLSAHLHFGEISPQQIWLAVQQQMQEPDCNLTAAHSFLSELGWREFSYHLLFHAPELPSKNFKAQFDFFPWNDNEQWLKCWQKGLTGYPIVDAGMRELWHTGFMHNRVRMIVASFLTKDLLIDWRKGADWFWDTLLDADLASNSFNWQWVAGSGADAAPYYRIFNPTLQGEKFDPQGEYVKRWIPELASLPKQWIHHPWDAPKSIRASLHYPEPIVEHAAARNIALDYYKSLAEQEKHYHQNHSKTED